MKLFKPITTLLAITVAASAIRAKSDDPFGPDGVCNNPYPTFDLSKSNQPLVEPLRIRPDENGTTKVQLSLNLAHYIGPSYTTIMRTYNEMAPGPTIHVIPGGTMELELINCLHEPLGFDEHNSFSTPNTTNIHTHGPHISGKYPGDDIFMNLGPNSSMHFEYAFPSNHMPGTHWIHPHFHGSTSLQTGQGVAGMLIVDPPDNYHIPDEIKNMPEVRMMVQNINVPHLRAAANVSQDDVTNYVDHNFKVTNTSTTADILMLVNMQFVPVVTMEKDVWVRWRMVLSSIDKTLAFLSETGQCEFKLLAKDGIFLNDAPRNVTTVILSPGNRADVAVRCSKIGQENMKTAGHDRVPLVSGYGGFNPDTQPTILVVDVVAPSGQFNKFELEPFDAPTPCYLVDLQDVDACEIETTFSNVYHCINRPSQLRPWPSTQTPRDLCGVYGPDGNGGGGDPSVFFPFKNKDNYVLEFPVGTVQQLTLGVASFHPYHQHVNAFQITSININNPNLNLTVDVATWYQVGDHQDTLQLPNFRDSPETSVTVRYQADYFTGKMVQHCHMLDHEDQGMMAVYSINGEEGTMWDKARDINPTCIMPDQSSKDDDDEGSGSAASEGGSKKRKLGSKASEDKSSNKSTKGSKRRTCNKEIIFGPLPSYGYDIYAEVSDIEVEKEYVDGGH